MPQTPYVPRPTTSDLEVSGAPITIKASPGTLWRVNVNTASSVSVATCYDSATVGGIAAANLIYNIPESTTGPIELQWPCENGITIVPGAGGKYSISYE